MGEWQLTTTLGRVGEFLEAGLRFDVRVVDGVLTGVQRRTSGASVRYVVRAETEESILDRHSADYLKAFEGRPSAIQTKGYILFSEELLRAAREYEERLRGVEGRGLSPLALSPSKIALRSRELIAEAEAKGVSVTGFRAFLRTFVDVDRLRERSLATAVSRDTYIEPGLLVGGAETSVESLLDEHILPRRGERFVVVHAPGGRGKTALSEHLTRELFQRSENRDVPVPFLIKFEDHRSVTGLDVLIHDTLRQYGLHFDLGPEAADRLIRYGVFILIFDGFDELSEHAGEQVRARNVKEFAPKIHRDTAGRAILTCRSTFLTSFPKLLEEVQRESEGNVLLVELQQLDAGQVRDYLVLNPPSDVSPTRHRDRVLTYLHRHKRLWELAQEPLTLGMMSELIGATEWGLPESLAGVYDRFVEHACLRESKRHDLPADLPQRRFLAALAGDMLALGQFTLERYWVEGRAEECLAEHGHAWTDETKRELRARLMDHYMFAPESLTSGADIKFRHTGFRDFLVAWQLADTLHRGGDFADALSTAEIPVEVLGFLAESLNEADTSQVTAAVPRIGRVGTRNLVRLVGIWENGRFFREFFPPPSGLRDKTLDALVLDSLDLRGYNWQRVGLDGATLRDCDLSEANLGEARWRELRIERCTLEGTDLGEHGDRSILLDGQQLSGEGLRSALVKAGALGPGVRRRESPPVAQDQVIGIMEEIFRKVVEGERRETVRLRNVLPETFLRGRLLGDQGNRVLVRDVVVPATQRKWTAGAARESPYLVPSGDRHGTLTLARDRASEVLDFIFNGELSPGLSSLIKYVRSRE